MRVEQRGRISQALLLVVVAGFAFALVFAFLFAACDSNEVGRLFAGLKEPTLSSPGSEDPSLVEALLVDAPARSLRLAAIPEHSGVLIPKASDDRPRVFTPSKPGACLHFIHIPKTGGSTLENLWDSKNPSADPRVQGWSRANPAATCTGNKPGVPRLHHVPGKTLSEMYPQEKFRRCKVPGGVTCNFFHTPPGHDPLLWKTGYEPCDTFCIARHPLDKFESEWQYRTGQKCNTLDSQRQFNSWARGKLRNLSSGSLYIDDCHLLPTTKFVYHSASGAAPKRTCTHVLRFDRMEEDFDQLMKAYNYPVSLNGRIQNKRSTCTMNIPDDILAQVRLVYAEDYGLFGFD